MADPLEEIATKTLLSLSQYCILLSTKDEDGSNPLTLPAFTLSIPPLSNEQGRTPAGSPLRQTQKLQCIEPVQTPDNQVSSFHREGITLLKCPVLPARAAVKALIKNLPHIRSYEREMLWMKNVLEDEIVKLCSIWEVLDDSKSREEHEKTLVFHMDSIFRLSGENDGQKSTLEQECAKMQYLLNWLSPLIQFHDPNGPFQPQDHREKVGERACLSK
ncbi:hypothetical protein FBEOM_14668 [Fusarium beomiforme]|uniref:Uncharacterized protein n=1 Tax=Fusarium beomiforme TaxID=44412 RepID=A0A9P5A4F7_9HYPO|nr:hypothetical protein FBEOM_14668 [Fusarium beomiforme]